MPAAEKKKAASMCDDDTHEPLSSMDQICPMAVFDITYVVETASYIDDAAWDDFSRAAERALDAVTRETYPFLRLPLRSCEACGMHLVHGGEEMPPHIVFRTEADHPVPRDTAEVRCDLENPLELVADPLAAARGANKGDGDRAIEAAAAELGSKTLNLATAWPRWIPPAASMKLRDPAEAEGVDRSLYIVVTRLSRGFCASVKLHHSVGDGHSLSLVVNDWSARTREELAAPRGAAGTVPAGAVDFDTTKMVGDASRFDAANAPRLASFLELPIPVMNDAMRAGFAVMAPTNKVVASRFTRASIEALRAEPGCSEFTSNDLVLALAVRDACARALDHDDAVRDEKMAIQFPANLRARLDNMGDRFFGNAVTFCGSDPFTFGWGRDAPLSEVAALVSRTKFKCTTPEHVNGLIDWEMSRGKRPRVVYMPPPDMGKAIMLTNWSHFPFYDADWGLGELTLVSPFNEINFPYMGFVLPSKRKGEITTYVHVPANYEKTPPFG